MVLTEDPYVVIHYVGQSKKSSVKNNIGRHPQWNEKFSFKRNADILLRVEVWDRDTFTHDDLVGEGHLNIYSILTNA
jgi:Ca2+-dependent lipid-binding protein